MLRTSKPLLCAHVLSSPSLTSTRPFLVAMLLVGCDLGNAEDDGAGATTGDDPGSMTEGRDIGAEPGPGGETDGGETGSSTW